MKAQLILKGIAVLGIAHIPSVKSSCSPDVKQTYFSHGKYNHYHSEARKVQIARDRRTQNFNRTLAYDKNLIMQNVYTETLYANAITFIAGAY